MTAETALAKAQARLAEMRAQGWRPVRLNPKEAAAAKPNSLKLAIRAHCWDCAGGDADSDCMSRVRDCSVKQCALWPHRPWQNYRASKPGQEADTEAVEDPTENFEEEHHD